ncbi:MAG: hypothetical protein IJ506_02940 [Clostridia bacterium]|nr:hypothetical protein [Clostridia bacterium]
MRRIKVFLLLLMVFVLSSVVFTACAQKKDSGNGGTIEQIPSNDIELSVATPFLDLLVGDESNVVANYTTKEGLSLSYDSVNPSVATVDTNGKIVAVGVGETTVKVIYGEETATVSVKVGLGNLQPTLQFTQLAGEEFSVMVKDEISLKPTVLFNGKEFSADEVTYTQTTPSVADIQDGIFTPKARGTTEVTVSCKWQGKSFATLEKTFTITAMNSVELLLNGKPELSDTIVYTMETFGDNTFPVSAPFDVEATINGETMAVEISVVEGTELIEYNENAKTVSVSEAKKSGVATVRLAFTGFGETITHDIKVTIKPSYTVYDGEAILFSAMDGDLPVANIFGETTQIVSAETQTGDPIEVKDGKITGIPVDVDNAGKERSIRIFNESYGYEVQIKPYTKIIKKAEDLSVFQIEEVTQNADILQAHTSFDGYYILGNDIDATDYQHQAVSDATQNANLNKGGEGAMIRECRNIKGGLTGIFDGCGYTVSGLTVIDQGLFGLIDGGTVKNVGFENVTLNGSAYRKNIALFAQQAKNATFENVYVQANTLYGGEGQTAQTSDARGNRALLALGLDGKTTVSNSIFKYNIENTKIQYCYTYGLFGSDIGFFGHGDETRTGLQFNNVYVISNAPLSVQNDSLVSKEANTHVILAENEMEDGKSKLEIAISLMEGRFFNSDNAQNTLNDKFVRLAKGIKLYASIADMQAAANDYSAFINRYWNVTEGFIPYFKTGLEQLSIAVDGTYELDMENGFTDAQLAEIFQSETVELESAALVASKLNVTDNVIGDIPMELHGETITLTLKIKGTEATYAVNVIPVTKYIKIAQDLSVFQMSDATCTTEFAGYYVLANNINALDYTHTVDPAATLATTPVLSVLDGVAMSSTPTLKGLTGTFDGRGYTISNLTVNEHGLFGMVVGGTIKNVGFTNLTLNAVVSRADTALFAQKLHLATVENVYAQVNEIQGAPSNNYATDAGGDRGFLADSIQGGTLKNCILVVEIANTYSLNDPDFTPTAGTAYYHAAYGALCARDVTEITGQWNAAGISSNIRSDVYVLSSAYLSFFNNTSGAGMQKTVYEDKGDGTFAYATWDHRIVDGENKFVSDTHYGTDKDSLDNNADGKGDNFYGQWSAGGVKRYETQTAMLAAGNDYTAFDAAYWSLEGGVPVWKSSIA